MTAVVPAMGHRCRATQKRSGQLCRQAEKASEAGLRAQYAIWFCILPRQGRKSNDASLRIRFRQLAHHPRTCQRVCNFASATGCSNSTDALCIGHAQCKPCQRSHASHPWQRKAHDPRGPQGQFCAWEQLHLQLLRPELFTGQRAMQSR